MSGLGSAKKPSTSPTEHGRKVTARTTDHIRRLGKDTSGPELPLTGVHCQLQADVLFSFGVTFDTNLTEASV